MQLTKGGTKVYPGLTFASCMCDTNTQRLPHYQRDRNQERSLNHLNCILCLSTEYSPSSALPSSGKAPSSGQNPASQPFLFSKSPQQWTVPSSGQKILRFLSDFVVRIFMRICCSLACMYTILFKSLIQSEVESSQEMKSVCSVSP